jgi:hypothetical protein
MNRPGKQDSKQTFAVTGVKNFFGFGRDVFISYHAEEGKAYAAALQQQLCSSKISVFFDDQEIGPGDMLPESLGTGIASSTALVMVASPLAWDRPWVRKEMEVYFQTHSNPRIIRIAFDNLEVPSNFPGAERIKQSVCLREDKENLKNGIVSEAVCRGINRSFSFIRARSRRRMVTLVVTTCVLAMIGYTTFEYFRGQDARMWVGTGGRSEIRYSYDDPQLSYIVGLPTKAEAYLDGKPIATAVLKHLDVQNKRLVGINVEETHMSKSGGIMYRGKIKFLIQHAVLTSRESEVPIEGKKKYDIFVSWPMGGGGP